MHVCVFDSSVFLFQDQFSFRLRSTFAFLHILIFLMSLYFYWRHNTYCEPYGIHHTQLRGEGVGGGGGEGVMEEGEWEMREEGEWEMREEGEWGMREECMRG